MTRWLQAAKRAESGWDKWDKTDRTNHTGQIPGSSKQETPFKTGTFGVLSHLSVLSGGDQNDFRSGDNAQCSPTPNDSAALNDEFEERAAILEFDAGFSRQDAEQRARLEIYGLDTVKGESQ